MTRVKGCLICIVVLSFIIEIPTLTENSIDHNKTPHTTRRRIWIYTVANVPFMWEVTSELGAGSGGSGGGRP